MHRSVWWVRYTPEPHLPIDACAEDGSPADSPFDLYCGADQEHFLLLRRSAIRRHTVLNAYRVALGTLVLVAAKVGSDIPLYVAAWLAGALLLALPLRKFRASQTVSLLVWSASLGLAAADYRRGLAPSVFQALVHVPWVGWGRLGA